MSVRKHFQNFPHVSRATYNAALRDFRERKQNPATEREWVAELLNELEELSPDLARVVKTMQQRGGIAKTNARTLLFILYCVDRQLGSERLEQWFEDETGNK